MNFARWKIWTGAVALITAIWLATVLGGWVLGKFEPTAARVSESLVEHPLKAFHGSARETRLAELADQVNRLNFQERQALRRDPVFQESFTSMSRRERADFIQATLPRGMQQLMESLNRMEPSERERLVRRTLRRMEEADPDAAEERLSDEDSQRIIEQGLKAFYEDATPETRLQLAPVIEQMQRQMQRLR